MSKLDKATMHLNLDLIQTPNALKNLTSLLKKEEVIAIDTEFIRERTFFPNLALIQIATAQEAWLVDVLAFSNRDIQPLLEILQDPNILKLLHSSFGDQECFFSAYGITAKPTFDTFEAASLVGYGESVSLTDLLKKALNVKIPKSLARTDWLRRPMSDEMKMYAMADVEYLVPLYEKLEKGLEAKQRKDWAYGLSAKFEDPKLYQINPGEIAQRIARSGRVSTSKYPYLVELVAWREKRATQLNIPRKRIADDSTLIHISNARPKTLVQLKSFRGLNPGEVKRHGEEILAVLQKEPYPLDPKIPPPPNIRKPTAEQARVIDFLSTYLKALCKDLKIASRLILTSKGIGKIVVENLLNPEQWVKTGICSAEGCKLVGKDFVAVLQGKRALAIQNGKLEVLELDS